MFQKRKVGSVLTAALATGALVAVSFAGPAYAGGGKGPGHGNGGGGHGHGNPAAKSASEILRKAVTADGITKHLQALQDIADANGGNRAAGTPGHVASADYMEAKLKRAGYTTWRQPFSYDNAILDSEVVLEQTAPTPITYGYGVDFTNASYSLGGDVTAPVQSVDLNLTDRASSTSGCETTDFTGFTAGNIALMQRGTCSFRIKAENAAAAGASGAVIFNQGTVTETDDRTGLLFGTLEAPVLDFPVLTTTFALGEQLAATAGATLHLAFEAHVETINTFNLLADSRGNPNETVVVGGHLDGVPEGPGINDNGSGTASILETALQMSKKKLTPKNQVRFAFWSGEEDGLQGSNYYVSQLTEAQIAQHALNLNFDMVGSPNAVRFVYDGDGSAFDDEGPAGSDVIEDTFNEYFASQGLATAPTEFDGRSDYFAFIDAGIPAGGLFTGAEGIKSAEQAAIFGGTAGEPYDPCYHAACDDINNIDPVVLGQMADAIAHSTATFAEVKTKKHGGKGHGKGHHYTDRWDHKGPRGDR